MQSIQSLYVQSFGYVSKTKHFGPHVYVSSMLHHKVFACFGTPYICTHTCYGLSIFESPTLTAMSVWTSLLMPQKARSLHENIKVKSYVRFIWFHIDYPLPLTFLLYQHVFGNSFASHSNIGLVISSPRVVQALFSYSWIVKVCLYLIKSKLSFFR